MSILSILYWIILVLSIVGVFAPTNTIWLRVGGGAQLVLFVIIGLKMFRIPLQ